MPTTDTAIVDLSIAQIESMALARDMDAARDLLRKMRQITLAEYGFPWHVATEFLLWEEIALGERRELRELHEQSGGWWSVLEHEPIFFPTNAWEALLDEDRPTTCSQF